jgi:hypothetical protein
LLALELAGEVCFSSLRLQLTAKTLGAVARNQS